MWVLALRCSAMTTARRTSAATRAPRSQKRTRLDVEVRRAQLVDLGLVHFGDRPYDEVSIDEIAAAAGISKGLVFHYFDTKKDFYAATVSEAARRLLEKTALDKSRPPLERLREGLDTYLGYVKGHGRAYVELLRSGTGVDPAIARVVEDTRAEFLSRLTSGFEHRKIGARTDANGESGGVDAMPPRTRIALRGWVGMVEAASVEWVARAGATRTEVVDLLVRALLDVLQASM
jgi:AcrR family transcriptional regulator